MIRPAMTLGNGSSRRHRDDYWSQTRQPLVSLLFLAPLLVIYEIGAYWVEHAAPVAVRNGADTWMRSWLWELGLTQIWLLPVLIVTALLAWHIAGRYPWRVSGETIAGMGAESVLFAFLLIVVGQLQDLAFSRGIRDLTLISGHLTLQQKLIAVRAVTFLGAGIYEEVLFRLCLLPACYGVFRLAWLGPRWAAVGAILATSLLFALAHHLGPASEPFTPFTLTFRTVAGVFFSALFVLRGFGITVGCHAAYDLLVGIVMQAG